MSEPTSLKIWQWTPPVRNLSPPLLPLCPPSLETLRRSVPLLPGTMGHCGGVLADDGDNIMKLCGPAARRPRRGGNLAMREVGAEGEVPNMWVSLHISKTTIENRFELVKG
jgi:hypothetical protein